MENKENRDKEQGTQHNECCDIMGSAVIERGKVDVGNSQWYRHLHNYNSLYK